MLRWLSKPALEDCGTSGANRHSNLDYSIRTSVEKRLVWLSTYGSKDGAPPASSYHDGDGSSRNLRENTYCT